MFSIVLMLITSSFSQGITAVAREIKDPKRNLFKALTLGYAIIMLVYLLANVSYFAILTKSEFLSSRAIAVVSFNIVLTNPSSIHFSI